VYITQRQRRRKKYALFNTYYSLVYRKVNEKELIFEAVSRPEPPTEFVKELEKLSASKIVIEDSPTLPVSGEYPLNYSRCDTKHRLPCTITPFY